MKRITALAMLLTLPGLALAHGDAGHHWYERLVHILTSQAHLLPLLVIAMIAGLVRRPISRALRRRAAKRA